MPNKIDALYSEVSKSYEVGSIDDFKKYLADPKKRQLFFKEVIAPEYDVKSIEDFDEAYGFKKKSTESLSQGAQKDIFSVSGETPKAGPSAPSVNPPSNKLQEELFQKSRLAASAFVNPMKPGYTPVPEAEAKKAFYGKANVEAGTLRGIPGETKSTVANLNDKYKKLGVQFKEAPSKIQKSFGLGDIVVTADDGSTHIVQSTGADEKLREEEAKLQEFLMGKSAGAEKKEVTPMDFLMMSRDGISPQEEGKFKRVYSQEMVDNSIKFANDELNNTKKAVDDINKEVSQLNEEAKKISEIVAVSGVTPEIEETYNSITQRYQDLQARADERVNYAKSIATLADEGVKKAAGENTRLLSYNGNIPSALYNSLLKGAKDLVGGAMAALPEVADIATLGASESFYGDKVQAKEDSKKFLDEIYDNLKADGVSKEYTTQGNMAWKALFSVPEFIPSLLVPGGAAARVTAMTTQGIGRRYEEMNSNPETKNLIEEEKFFMAAGPALVEAKLENFGLTQWLGANKGLTSSIFVSALSKVAPKAGIRGLNKIINAEINNLVLRGAANTAGAMISEFETGALQNISETAFRDAYEIAKDKNLFKQPGFGEDGFKKALLEDAMLESLGGMWMAGAVNIAQQTSSYITGKSNTNETFRLVKQILADETTSKSLIATLKSQIMDGKLSKEQAVNTINNFNEARAITMELPQDLSEDNQRKAFDLIAEKRKLSKQIEGKDPSLVDKQKTRITAIDQELKNISNAVQEQTTSEVPVQPEARVGEEVVEGKPQPEPEVVTEEGQVAKEEIATKQSETESKIKRKDLFDGVGTFSRQLGGSDVDAVPVSHSENNGIEFVQYANPNTGSIDVVVTGTSENDYVGFYRIYENGKPTNKWSSKFENQSRNKENFKTMISGVQSMLPSDHEYTEKTSISTDGLRVWNQQLGRGYELQFDEKGDVVTNEVSINGDAIVNELGVDVVPGNFQNISVTTNDQFDKAKKAILPYLESMGLGESNIKWENGTVKIDLPVLKKSTTVKDQKEVSVDKQAIANNTSLEVDSIKNAAVDVETGQTFNIDGTVYTGGGLVVPVASQNLTQEELTPELIADFVEQNKSKVGSNAVKVGIYKFPNSNKVSIDLNIVVPRENREAALEFGRLSGQESLFDLDTFENVKTGADGNNPIEFNDDQFVDIAKKLESGIVPDVSVQTEFDQALNKSAQALNMVAPGLKVIVGENIDDVQNQIVEALAPLVGERQAVKASEEFAQGTRGQTIFVDGKPVAIVFDKTTADSRTIGHEAWETMLNDAFGNDQAKFKEFTAGIDAQLRAQGFTDIADALDAFASQKGYEAVKYSEYMAELGGMLVEAGFGKGSLTAQQKTLLQKIGDIINKFAELFTGKKQFLDQATPEDILGFMVTISEKVAKGEDVSSFFRKGEKAKAKEGVTSRKQAEKIFTGEEKVPTFKSLPEIANWLEGWSKKNKIFAKDIKDVSDQEFVKKLESHTLKELAAWDGVRGQDYVSFYVGDIVDRLNPKLQKFAEARYGRMLTPGEVTLYHAVSGFASPQADPMFDSSKGLEIFDKYMNGGKPDVNKLSGYADKQATIYELNDKGKKVDTGKLKFDKEGNPVYSQVSMHYAVPSLNKMKAMISHFEGDVEKAMEWMTSIHSYEEISEVMGTPLKGAKALTPHENLSKEDGGFGIFGFTGAKLGSYILNRVGEYSTVTKDMWYARTMARLVGEPLTKDGKAMTDPWAAGTVAGVKKRKLADQAWESVAKKLNISPSDVQERMWDFEKRLYEKMGAIEKASYASEGFMKTAKKLEPGLDLETKVVESRSQKNVPPVVDEVLTDDGKGNYLFVHYSDENRDVIKPMSGSKSNFTSREEVSAISAVGGVAMYYTKSGQKESGVGNVPHTVLVPKDKVYFYGSTKKGTVSHDPEGFEEEARQRFQAYRNRGNEDRPTKYAFDANNSAAWVTKVAGENGYDMLVTNWGGPNSYRAQTTKALKPEAEYTGFKKPEPVVFEVGDEVFLYGRYATIVAVDGDVLSYESQNDFGRFDTGKFTLSPYTSYKITMIEKAKPSVTTRSQKVEVKTIPGYDRMMNEVEGIMDKSINRGRSYNQTSANAVDYIQKSSVYERADDSQREQIIRDFKKIRGEKFKTAPSVAKILGQIEDVKKVTVKESTALKDQIKLEAKAAKDSAAFVKQLRMDISGRLKSMVGRGMMSARQATAIISRYDKMNILNPVMRDRFVDYMSRVFQSAEYMDKIKEASKLRASIKKAMKSPANQAEIAKLAKDFGDIDPSRVENIDDYINNATQMLNAVARKTGDPLMRSLVNAADMNSYIDIEIEAQREQIKNELLDKYKELVDAGVLSSDMTINEIKKVVAAIEENDSDAVAKEEKAKAAVKEMMAEVSPLIVQIVKTGEDPFTGEPISLTQDEKKSLIALTNIDTDSLSLSEALQVLEYANNFVANGITSGIDGMVSLYQGGLNAGELVDDGIKSIPLSKYFSGLVGRVWGEGFATLPMLNKLLWGNTRRAIMVSEKAGINGVSNGKAKALKMVDNAVKQYVKLFSKTKDFLASENVVERGVFAFMSRNVVGDEFQAQDEFNRRKSLIKETIQALSDVDNNTESEIKKGEVIQKVYDKVLKDAKNINDVKKNVSQINQDAVNWWINKWSENFDRIDEVSRNVYNTQLSRDIDFTPDRFQLKEAPTAVEEDFESGFFGNFEYVDTSKSGSLRKNNRISNLPKDKNGVKTRIVNLDFDVNNVNALTSAMVDVETASSVMQMKGFVTSKNFSKLFSNKEDKNLYKKRLIKYVNRAKGGSYVDQNELSKINRTINTIASFGVAKALFSVSQPFKQFFPPMINTFVQTGRFDLNKLLYNGGMGFIDSSGYPIANRGVASQGELKSINRQLVEAEKNLAMRGLDGVAEFSNKTLEITLKNPDIFAARASWISFYLSKLKKQGVNISGIDFNTHELNKDAADYAQAMVDSQQNISDTDMQGEIFASKQPATVFLRRAILPLMTFTLNQKTRIWSDVRTLSNDVSSKNDKVEAAKSLSGALIELVAFQGIVLAFKELYNVVAAAIMGEDEDEEEKKIRKMRQSQSTAQAFMKDFFLPPIPGMDILASKGVNYLLDETGLSDELPYKWYGIEDEEQKFRLYDKMNKGYLDMLGTQGIAAEKALELIEYYDAAIDGEFTKEYNGNKVKKALMEEDLDIARMNAIIMTAYYGGVLPSDMANIVNIMNKKIQKRAEQVDED